MKKGLYLFILAQLLKGDKLPEIVWKKVFDSNYTDLAYAIVLDKKGNIYVTGASGEYLVTDFLTLKYDNQGELLWQSFYDGGTDSLLLLKYTKEGDLEHDKKILPRGEGYDIACDETGYVYITGTYLPGTGSDFLTVKCDTNGEMLWYDIYRENLWNHAQGVVYDSEGNLYIVGILGSSMWRRYYSKLVKYDKNGNMVWDVSFADSTAMHGIEIDKGDFLYVVGSFYNGRDKDILVVKLNESGEVLWENRFDRG